MDTFIEVLKWVGIVLAAGFIGYFGLYLAVLIIDRVHRKELRPPPTPKSAGAITLELMLTPLSRGQAFRSELRLFNC